MLYFRHADVAQWIERPPPERKVAGSSPVVSVTSRNPLPNAPPALYWFFPTFPVDARRRLNPVGEHLF
jgi:hypothetical protein